MRKYANCICTQTIFSKNISERSRHKEQFWKSKRDIYLKKEVAWQQNQKQTKENFETMYTDNKKLSQRKYLSLTTS